MIATVNNMDQLRRDQNEPIAAKGVFMYSIATGERFSASPGDYFGMDPNEPLTDCEGNPMFLCRETTSIDPIHALNSTR